MRLILIVAAAIAVTGHMRQTGTVSPVPVLVELFTAEGCSSCPPADVLLAKMLEAQPAAGATLVGLGEHVDYWNQSGWKDRFASAMFTRRQQQYAARSRSDNVYTPEMVVDGGDGFVGTDIDAARHAIERAVTVPHGEIRIDVDPNASDKRKIAVAVDIRSLSGTEDDPADLLLAVTEDGLHTDVKRGENQGRSLTHAAVVREMVTVASVTASGSPVRTTVRVDPSWRRDALKIVAFVQQRRSRHVIATAVRSLEDDRPRP